MPAQVTDAEINAGTETGVRLWSPKNQRDATNAAVLPEARTGNTDAWSTDKTGAWIGTAAQYAALSESAKDPYHFFFTTA